MKSATWKTVRPLQMVARALVETMKNSFTFAVQPDQVFSDVESRTIKGLAIPIDATADRGGRQWRFLRDSVTFAERTPLLQYHDATRPVGKLTAAEWTDRGLEVAFRVSNTSAGSEALELANDGVLGFSVGIDVPEGGGKLTGNQYQVSNAIGREVSLTPVPAFAGAVIDTVNLSKDEAAMPDESTDNTVAGLAALTERLTKLDEKIDTFANRPEPQAAPVQVKEAPLYRLDGPGGQFSFSEDIACAYKGDGHARERLDTYIQERFAVASTDVTPDLAPAWRQDLYVGPRPYQRVLDAVITRGTLDNIQPFAFPKFVGTSGTLVAPHVEGVEPTLAGASWTSQTVTPAALSGKSEFTRETIDLAGPAAQSMIWNEMVKASEKAAEARLVTLLDGLTLPAGQVKAVNGTGPTLANNLDAMLLALNEPSRFNGAVAAPTLFSDLYTASDTTGRRLFSAVAPSNANGTATGRRTIDANGIVFIQGKDSAGNGTTNSYLVDSSTVYQFLSTPRRLDFDIQVKSIFMGFWQYSAEAVTDTTGVIRVTHASS
jgi:HK97 family phage prohead protease